MNLSVYLQMPRSLITSSLGEEDQQPNVRGVVAKLGTSSGNGY